MESPFSDGTGKKNFQRRTVTEFHCDGKILPFIQVQTSFHLESIKLENGYNSEENEELWDLEFFFLKLLKTFFFPQGLNCFLF